MCQSKVGGSIDPSPYVGPDGQAYLFWKSTNRTGASTIFGQRLASGGRALTGPRAELLVPTADWEQPQVEGPSMIQGPRGYYLFYSAGVFNTPGYAICYAICTKPLQDCRKVTTRQPWLATNAFAAGPGGQSFFRGSRGACAWHTTRGSPATWAADRRPQGKRSLWIGHLSFDSVGRPVLSG
ncbi:MAG: family 43 glycosylhydrolase [Frankiaceae bacterium]